METTNIQDQVRENFILSTWPQNKSSLTIDPNCLAASLWLRSQRYSYTTANTSRQFSMIFRTYPALRDTINNKLYVGFESIYEFSRKLNPTADELALVATFKRLFIPAFMHSQWLDEMNKQTFRTLYHCTIGLPTSLFFIRKRFLSAKTWLRIIPNQYLYTNNNEDQVYVDAERCLSILDNRLTKTKQQFLGGERFSLIDAWVSAYLLVLFHYASEKSRLRILLAKYSRLTGYIKRIDEELLSKEYGDHPLLSSSTVENSSNLASVLYVLSQVVSFSIFFFMLTKIGANSYSISS